MSYQPDDPKGRKESLEKLVQCAISGDKQALEQVILEIKDLVYNLSLKMLLFPEDAQDASQEILVRIITHLSSFQGKSQFKTWVYRVASNYLLTTKGKNAQPFAMSFDDYAVLVDSGQVINPAYDYNSGEIKLLEDEVKISCTQGLLLCLNESHRLVYILGEILEFDSREGAQILDMSRENYRQQLSRARTKIRNFLQQKCGLVNPKNPCRCHKKIDFLSQQGLLQPLHFRFTQKGNRSIDLFEKLGHLEKSVAIYRSTPHYQSPDQIVQKIKGLIQLF